MARKLNIHYTLDPRSKEGLETINAAISRRADSLIRFGPEVGDAVPHITILVGLLKQDHEIRDLARDLKDVASESVSLVFRPGCPYVSRLNGSYVLSDLEPTSTFIELQSQLLNRLKHIVDFLRADPVPHVTLAYVERANDVIGDYLSTLTLGSSISCPALEVSDVGDKGTCINSLLKFRLGYS